MGGSCIRKGSGRRFVGNGPTEVHLGFHDLLTPHREDFCVAKASSIDVAAFIGHEHQLSIGDKMDLVKGTDLLTIRPAAPEIGAAIEAIIEGACEVEVICNQRLDDGAVLANVSVVTCASNSDRIVLHCVPSPSSRMMSLPHQRLGRAACLSLVTPNE